MYQKKGKKKTSTPIKIKVLFCHSNTFYAMLLRFLFNSPDDRGFNCIISTEIGNRSFNYLFGSSANILSIFGYYTDVAAFAVSFKCNNIALLHVYEINLFIHPSFQNILWCWIGPFVSKNWCMARTVTNFTSLSIRIETIIETISKDFFHFCCIEQKFLYCHTAILAILLSDCVINLTCILNQDNA